MTPCGRIIPITEDDQGEGYMNVLSLDDIEAMTKFDDSDFALKMEKFQRRKENKSTRKGSGN